MLSALLQKRPALNIHAQKYIELIRRLAAMNEATPEFSVLAREAWENRTLINPGERIVPSQIGCEYDVGKVIGGAVYVHVRYVLDVVPPDLLAKAGALVVGFNWMAVRYDPKKGTVRFDEAPDFDSAREPRTGYMVTVFPNGTTRNSKGSADLPSSPSDRIWHHKWMWVRDDYNGFDVAESKRWSGVWPLRIKNKSKIGTRALWEAAL